MASIIRKISIGADYKNDAMHYATGQQVYGGHTISDILFDEAEGGSCSVYVGAGTGIKVELVSAPLNQTITITAVPGTVLPFSVRKIYTTDTATTATQIIALY